MYRYERVDVPDGLRLHLNENTAGCSPAVMRALADLTRHDAAFYPDYAAAHEACAAWLGVSPDAVLLTNGLDEGILAITAAAFAREASPEAIVIVPAFDMYAAVADALGGHVTEVPLEPGFTFPLAGVVTALTPRTRLVWITDPHNPTGQPVPPDAILQIAAAAPNALVVVDEAYADFAGTSLLEARAFARLPNLVVGRTFAKAHGLAGLRAGVLVANPPTLEAIRAIVPPYSINAWAARALPAALGDREYYAWYLAEAERSKALLYAVFESRGIEYWRSAANFVLARPANASALVGALARKGIHIRDKSRDPGCAGCIRVTAGVVAHTQAFIAALEEVLCGGE